MTAGGVPAGANTAVQDPDCAFFTPASSMVGTSGMAGDRHGFQHRGEQHVHAARHQVRHGRAAAFVWHMHQVHAGGLLEDLGGQVRGAAGAGTGKRVLAGFGTRQRH
ncbi:hypothetical protein G6F55_014365 [Rhizopus delemar]|nr:hypothetical protein G6F55_014365 [Rhizopus delemar]